MTRHCSTSENGKLPGPDSQLNTFDQPEPQRQLLWDNRPSEACRAAALWAQRVSDQQAEHRAAGSAPR
ncbi:Efflux pump FUS6 [Dissostichus eleginoides]|uniref:Efflux pump FUS6 n=1 Tax=Dissostichus eleginoides TaxID=100907 RepID=A0AAD9C0A0_DISEL|nr:Efflux pump FUS6 [Dissostichus eleginoides]